MSELQRRRDSALAFHHAGNLVCAETAYRAILSDYPSDGQTWHLLAVLSGQRGDDSSVIAHSKQALDCGYRSDSTYHNLCTALQRTQDPYEAATAAQQGLQAGIDDLEIAATLVETLQAGGHHKVAHVALLNLVARSPGNAELQELMAKTASALNLVDTASNAFRAVRDLQPDCPKSLLNLGIFLLAAGNPDAAKEAVEQALRLDNTLDPAYWLLCQLTPPPPDSQFGRQLLLRLRDDGHAASAPLHFAAATMFNEQGRASEAFAHLERGNLLVRQTYTYDVVRDERAMSELAGLLHAPVPVPAIARTPQSVYRPIFVTGLPRTGSTLLESILARHPQVYSAGELPWLQRFIREELHGARLPYPQGLWRLDSAARERIRHRYTTILEQHLAGPSPGLTHVVDKLPANVLYLPLIRDLFPEAVIIITRRAALATCWSCYRHLFSGPQHFAYDQTELGRYYRAHAILLQALVSWAPEWVYAIDHDALLADPHQRIKELLVRCGLPFDKRCETPERQQRLVATASALQVRRTVGEGLGVAADRYRPFLGPLLEALGGQ